MRIDIRVARVSDPDSLVLISELDAELEERYPGEPTNGLQAQEFEAAGGYFIVAVVDSRAVGCGAFRPLDPSTVEIKRMFVTLEHRGRGVARTLLSALEKEARRRGYCRAILETGDRQPEALSLYRSTGYAEIGRFGAYADSEHSVCFEKEL